MTNQKTRWFALEDNLLYYYTTKTVIAPPLTHIICTKILLYCEGFCTIGCYPHRIL